MRVIGVIPARMKSSRFPGKPLADICGKPMIWWVYRQAIKVKELEEIIVATDDTEIKKVCKQFDIPVIMTSDKHITATDRVAEVATKIEADGYINIQGDEPMVDPETIRLAIKTIENDYYGNLAVKITNREEIEDVNNLKVVLDSSGYAMYESRSPIPSNFKGDISDVYKVIGIYAYRRDFLFDFLNMKPSTLELSESTDPLRAMQNGYKLKVLITDNNSIGVDSPEDLEKVRVLMKKALGDGTLE